MKDDNRKNDVDLSKNNLNESKSLLDKIIWFYFKYIKSDALVSALFFFILGIITISIFLGIFNFFTPDVENEVNAINQSTTYEQKNDNSSKEDIVNDKALNFEEIYNFINSNQSNEDFYNGLVDYLKEYAKKNSVEILIQTGNLVTLESLRVNYEYLILERGFNTLKKIINLTYYWNFNELNHNQDTILITIDSQKKIGNTVILVHKGEKLNE